jgi:ABC-type multidrug transport system permease subunit
VSGLELRTIEVLWRRTVVLAARRPVTLVTSVVGPAALWLGLASGGSTGGLRDGLSRGLDPFAVYFPAALVLAPILAVALLAGRVSDPRRGVLALALVGPGSRPAAALGVALGLATPGFVAAALLAALSPLAGSPYGSVQWPAVVTTLALLALGVSGGVLALSWAGGSRRAPALTALVLAPAFVFSGALTPAGPRPASAVVVDLVDPLAWAVGTLRAALGSGSTRPGAALAAFCIVAVALAALALSRSRPGGTP